MKKFFYCIGIYTTCVCTHNFINYWIEDYQNKRRRKNQSPTENRRHRSVNFSSGEVGAPMNRIGF